MRQIRNPDAILYHSGWIKPVKFPPIGASVVALLPYERIYVTPTTGSSFL